MSTFNFTGAGLTIQTQDEIKNEIGVALRTALNLPDLLVFDPASPEGVLIEILAERESLLQELVQSVYFSAYPQTASGLSFERSIRMAGIFAKPASPSTVELDLTAVGACIVTAGSLVAVTVPSGQGPIFAIDQDVVFPAAGTRAATATAQVVGPEPGQMATAGTVTTIVTPIANWTAVNNAADATPGENAETEAQALLRMLISFAGPGQSPVDSLRTQILAIVGVEQCVVLENTAYYADPATTDANGTLGKAVRCIVWPAPAHTPLPALPAPGSVEAQIAAAIWHGKTDGALSQGTIDTKTADVAGVLQPVSYETAASIPWNVVVQCDPAASATEIADITAAISAYAATVKIGGIVDYLQVAVAAVSAAPGKTNYDIGIAKNVFHNPALLTDTSDLTSAATQILTLAAGDIHVT